MVLSIFFCVQLFDVRVKQRLTKDGVSVHVVAVFRAKLFVNQSERIAQDVLSAEMLLHQPNQVKTGLVFSHSGEEV